MLIAPLSMELLKAGHSGRVLSYDYCSFPVMDLFINIINSEILIFRVDLILYEWLVTGKKRCMYWIYFFYLDLYLQGHLSMFYKLAIVCASEYRWS